MELPREWAQMDAEELRDLAATLISQLAERDATISAREAELSVRNAQIVSRDE